MSLSQPTPAQRYAMLLDRLIGSNQWERAAQTARDWLAEDPASLPAHRGLAQALVNLDQHAAAAPHIERALAGEPRDGFAHRLASIICFARKDFQGADDHIQQAIALQPEMAMHWYHLAWMRYQHGALEAAARYGQRALALAPQSADIINLLALCQRTDARTRLAQYERALALDPENSMVHNNVGAWYLHVDKNPGRALDSFRRSLQLDPTNETAQKNLFAALRECDSIYKMLRFPRTVLSLLNWRRAGVSRLAAVGALLGCLLFGSWLLLAYGAWLLVGAPLLKGYEYLTLRDVHAQAGLPGARRGGLWGFWAWPFAVRFGLYALVVAAFWGGVLWLARDVSPSSLMGAVIVVALVVVFWNLCANLYRASRRKIRNWRGERRFQRRMEMPPPPLPRTGPPPSFQP